MSKEVNEMEKRKGSFTEILTHILFNIFFVCVLSYLSDSYYVLYTYMYFFESKPPTCAISLLWATVFIQIDRKREGYYSTRVSVGAKELPMWY